MILKGSQRGSGARLTAHLLNVVANDHIEVHQLRGFLADDLAGAFAEIEAVALGTKCEQPFFSVSINPPAQSSATLTDKDFRAAAHQIERAHGLQGQPRAIVFHEKEGRRHAHVVWSRIDAQTMKARNLSHFKRKLMGVSEQLFLAHGFELPDGFKDPAKASTDRVDLAEWQAAKRRGRNAIDQKQLIRQCWEASDSTAAFAAALQEHGFALAQGAQRSHVVVSLDGQVIALACALGIKTKEVRARLKNADALPDVATAQHALAALAAAQTAQTARQVRADLSKERRKLDAERTNQIAAHRAARKDLRAAYEQRKLEALSRAKVSQRGLTGFWKRLVSAGQRRHALKAALAQLQTEYDADLEKMRAAQLSERRALEAKRTALRREAFGLVDDLHAACDVRDHFSDVARADPRQTFKAQDASGPVTDAEIRAEPTRLLERLSYFDARFTEYDITRALAHLCTDPITAKTEVLKSSQLVRLDGPERGYTTRDYVSAETRLHSSGRALITRSCKAPSHSHIKQALAKEDHKLARFNAQLSAEQREAVHHMTDPKGLSMVVGRAGTGKSTILAATHDAWTKAGIAVHGAALAGKAVAGLEDASGIASRTLASLELSWANGHEPIKPTDVLVIDEAGMVGTRQLDRIAQKIDQIGAKLVLVGDPDQLPPIEAGGPFRDLIDRYGAAWLTDVHRQRKDWQREATGDLAAGRITDAIATYEAQGCVSPAPNCASAIVQLTEDYLTDCAENAEVSRLILAHRRRDVHALNQSIRETRKATGGLTQGPLINTDHGPRELAPTDRIVFTANNRDIGVKNGMLGTVRTASETQVTVELDDGGKVTFDPHTFRAWDHGYAVTIHKSQGATVDQAYVLASKSMDNTLTYVALTRHRENVQMYIAKDDEPDYTHDQTYPMLSIAKPSNRDGPSLSF